MRKEARKTASEQTVFRGKASEIPAVMRERVSPITKTEAWRQFLEELEKGDLKPDEFVAIRLTPALISEIGVKHPQRALISQLKHVLNKRKLPYNIEQRTYDRDKNRSVTVYVIGREE